jgi:hypothetical protein
MTGRILICDEENTILRTPTQRVDVAKLNVNLEHSIPFPTKLKLRLRRVKS